MSRGLGDVYKRQGLTIARQLAMLLGGTLTLDTSYTDGARFKLVLPLE